MIVKLVGIGMMLIYNVFFATYCAKILTPRVPRVFLYGIIPFCVAGIFYFLSQFNILIPIIYIINFIVYLVVLRLCFKGKTSHIFWAVVNVIFHLLVVRAITVGVMSMVLNLNMFRIIENQELYFLSMTISMIIMALFLFIFNKIIDVNMIKLLLNNMGQFRFVCSTETVLLIFMFFCTYSYYYNLDLIWFTIFHILMALFSAMCFYVVLNMTVKTSVWIDEDYQGNTLLATMEKQQRQRLSFSQMSQALGQTPEVFSNISEVDCVLWDLAQDCKDNNIALSTNCQITVGCCLTHLHRWIVFTKLCENALEACKRQTSGDKWITIVCESQNGRTSIIIKNSFNGVVRVSERELVSTKRNKEFHGLGIKKAETIVENAGGTFSLSIDRAKHEFTVRISLPSVREMGES